MTREELGHIAPNLAQIKEQNRKSGFTVPAGYFKKIERRISKRLLHIIPDKSGHIMPESYLDKLEDTILSKTTKQTTDIPESYFDTLEDRIFEKLANEKKIIKFTSSKKTWIIGISAIAASILLFFTIYTPEKNSTIDTAEIETYILEGNLDIDFYEIANAIDTGEIDNLEVDTNLKEENLENYLLDTVSEEYFYN